MMDQATRSKFLPRFFSKSGRAVEGASPYRGIAGTHPGWAAGRIEFCPAFFKKLAGRFKVFAQLFSKSGRAVEGASPYRGIAGTHPEWAAGLFKVLLPTFLSRKVGSRKVGPRKVG